MLKEITRILSEYWFPLLISFSATMLAAYLDFQIISIIFRENVENVKIEYVAAVLLVSSTLKIVATSMSQIFIKWFCMDETLKILDTVSSQASLIDNESMASINTTITYKLTAIAGSIMAVIDSLKGGIVLSALVVAVIFQLSEIREFLQLQFLPIVFLIITLLVALVVCAMATWGRLANTWLNRLSFNVSLIHSNQVDVLLSNRHPIVSNIINSQKTLRNYQMFLQLLNQNFRYILEIGILVIILILSANTEGTSYFLFATLVFLQRFLPNFQSFINGFFTISASKAAIDELISIKKINYKDIDLQKISLSEVDTFVFYSPNLSSAISATSHQEYRRGQVLTVGGVSGSGKSTYLLQLCGILPSEGCLIVADKNHYQYRIASTYLMNNQAKVFGSTMHEYFGTQNEAWITMRLIELGINKEIVNKLKNGKENFAHSAQNLSSGELQRIKLVKAVTSDAELIILDEPFSALDRASRKIARSFIEKNLSDRFVVLVDHGDVVEDS